ncbi:MAG: thiamine diphosphokinase [Bacteroides sp.]|nr:thiamine diphosphokinase [Bacteroides sp.]
MKEIDAVILANGDYPSATLPLQILKKAPYVVCCDGGANEYIAQDHLPDVIIGDGDSLSEENRIKYASIIYYNPDQETNDQTKAVQFLLSKGKKKIAIVGATGKREDHTIGNVSLLMEYMRMGAEVRSYTDYGIFIPCQGTSTFECRVGQQLSIFNFTGKGLKAKGLAYPIYDFTTWWQGTLNTCTETSFTIEAQGEYLLFINY